MFSEKQKYHRSGRRAVGRRGYPHGHDRLADFRSSKTVRAIAGTALAALVFTGGTLAARNHADGRPRGGSAVPTIDYAEAVAQAAQSPIPTAVRKAASQVIGVMEIADNGPSMGSGVAVRQGPKGLVDVDTAKHVVTNHGTSTVPNETFAITDHKGTVQVDPITSERMPAPYQPATGNDVAELTVNPNSYGTLDATAVHAPNDFKSITGLQLAKTAPIGTKVWLEGKTNRDGVYTATSKTTITPGEIVAVPGGNEELILPLTHNGVGSDYGDSGGAWVNGRGQVVGIDLGVMGQNTIPPGGATITDSGSTPYSIDIAAATTQQNNNDKLGTDPIHTVTGPTKFYAPQ